MEVLHARINDHQLPIEDVIDIENEPVPIEIDDHNSSSPDSSFSNFSEDFWETEEIDKYLNDIALRLYGSPNYTIKTAIEFMKILKDFAKKNAVFLSERIKDCATISEAQQLIRDVEIFDFSSYLTEPRMKSKLKAENLYFEPEKFVVRNEVVEYAPGLMGNKEHEGVIMDIPSQIRTFLELDSVFEGIIDFQNKLMELPHGVYKNFVNGSFWRSVMENYRGKLCLPVFIYNDDFKIDDKKGPHSTTNTLSAFYYTFPSLPPHVSSKLDSIFPAMFVKAKDIKMYGITSPLYALVNVFSKLETQGLTLFAHRIQRKCT